MNDRYIRIDDTNFIFRTNLSGDPARDPKFHSTTRRANLIIPDEKLAMSLFDQGFNVKKTAPYGDEDPATFVPEYFVPIILNYNGYSSPSVYLVGEDMDPVLLSEDDLGDIDGMADSRDIRRVNAILNPYENKERGTKSLYVRTMYVEQDVESDPYASQYRRARMD